MINKIQAALNQHSQRLTELEATAGKALEILAETEKNQNQEHGAEQGNRQKEIAGLVMQREALKRETSEQARKKSAELEALIMELTKSAAALKAENVPGPGTKAALYNAKTAIADYSQAVRALESMAWEISTALVEQTERHKAKVKIYRERMETLTRKEG